MIKKIIFIIVSSWVLAGCVTGQHLEMNHTPTEPPEETKVGSVSLTVTDNRNFVLSKDKENYYIGQYRAGFGNPWDVDTMDKIPLAELILTDLSEELINMGFITSDAGKKLSVSIVDWNFDGYQNGRFWYEIKIDVMDNNGELLTTSILKDEVIVKGTITGSKGGFERDVPNLYNQIIDSIIRSNEDVLGALRF